MRRDLAELGRRSYDLVIIGGGAFGCCAAWEAASRGLSVALLEKEDFCHATSANHLKMVHGGIRYLQHLDIPRVRESLHERAALLRIAPHLVTPVPIVMPTYGHGLEGRLILGAGLKLYDAVAVDRNRGIADPAQQIPRGKLLTRAEVLELFPDLDTNGLTGAGLFYDGQFYNPPRLALAFIRAAVNAGANVANYVEATGFMRRKDTICGVVAKDVLHGGSLEIRSQMVLNAGGPWAAGLLREAIDNIPQPTFSRDAGLVLKGRRTGRHALACRVETSDPDAFLSRHGRHVFLVPWREHTLLGVWHRVHEGPTDRIAVDDEEIEGWLDEVNRAYPAFGLRLDDVAMVYAGLILFGENRPDSKDLRFGKRSLLIDHGREDGVNGLWTLIGVRATTARGMAEKTLDRILATMGRRAPSRTASTPLPGGNIEDFTSFLAETKRVYKARFGPEVISSLTRNYGSALQDVISLADTEPNLSDTLGDSYTIKAEVAYAARSEMALTLRDIVFRRTDLGTGGHPGHAALEECASLMGSEMNWNASKTEAELSEVLANFPR